MRKFKKYLGDIRKILFVEETFPQWLKPHSYQLDYAWANARILQNKAQPSEIKAHCLQN